MRIDPRSVLVASVLATLAASSAGCAAETDEVSEATHAAEPAAEKAASAAEALGLPHVKESYAVGPIELSVLEYTSDQAEHPTIRIPVPTGYRLLGGGARDNWSGGGNLLTGIYPDVDGSAWVASGKDHGVVSPSSITAQAIVARMSDGSPIGSDDYVVVSAESSPASHPQVTAILPGGFTLVGGGARDNWSGIGNLLVGSYPQGNGWLAAGKDHEAASTATITAYAIGVRQSFLDAHGIRVQQRQATTGSATNWPSATCSLDYGYRLLSGGARANYGTIGQLLTASAYLDRHSWTAASKDHGHPDLGTVTSYCIGISL